ncbi:isoamylase early set domain-containing protein [Roseisolibacter agri]|uniref:Glycoside hydrolase family 13 N-terminal domain-containing protein n=1 Tax=Roseisolibacter agri TaxID=2014610 RepID=A0AA37V1Z3_9BACT|nr:isoamylase early set domain-containing protein [Roseisolibacter agri]GLC27025.1 hypothetical protein rosag_35380 [Roseisolibacter agri]
MSTTPPHGERPTPDADELHRAAGLAPVIGVLRGLPPVPPGAVDRVVAAAVARGHRPGAGAARRSTGLAGGFGGWRVAAGLVLTVGLGAAAALTARGREAATTLARTPAAATVSAPIVGGTSAVAMQPADGDGGADFLPATAAAADADAPLPVAFLLRRPAAARVALVGDFNGWDPHATPLVRRDDGTWTTTVPLAPGRHAYAFVVNDSSWIPDPRVPVTRDVDYGRDHSIVVVGAP